eukprot:5597884-Pyramimonas_sp.AAC.1
MPAIWTYAVGSQYSGVRVRSRPPSKPEKTSIAKSHSTIIDGNASPKSYSAIRGLREATSSR